MSVSEIKLYKILKEKMGEDEAQSLVEYVETKIEAEFQEKQYVLATKQDLLVMRDELVGRIDRQKGELLDRMGQQKEELLDRMDQQKGELLQQMSDQKAEFQDLKVQVKSDKADIIKWMFIFWVGQLAVIIALFKVFGS